MPDSKKRFQKRVATFLNQNDSFNSKEIRRILTLLSQAEMNIINDLMSVPQSEFQLFFLNRMRGQVQTRINEMTPLLTGEVRSGDARMFEFSLDKADELMSASGIDVAPLFLDETVLSASQTLTGELIKTVPIEMQKRVGNTLALGLAEGKSASEVMADLRVQFDMTFNQAERIYRTELMRTQSLAQEKRFQQIQDLNPVYLKRWVWSHKPNGRTGHAEAERTYTANPIPFEDDFMVAPHAGGRKEAGQYPRDPAFSASNSINCGCIHLLVPPALVMQESNGIWVIKKSY